MSNNLAVISYYDMIANVKSCAPRPYNHTIITYYYNYNYDYNITAKNNHTERETREIDSTFNSIFIDNLEGA